MRRNPIYLANHINVIKLAVDTGTTSDPSVKRKTPRSDRLYAVSKRPINSRIGSGLMGSSLSLGLDGFITTWQKKPEPLALANQSVKLFNLTCISDKEPETINRTCASRADKPPLFFRLAYRLAASNHITFLRALFATELKNK